MTHGRVVQRHNGGAQIDSDSSDRALVQVNRGHRQMADVEFMRAQLPGTSIRERLRTQNDTAVVFVFLGGEEREFQYLIERYQTRLLNFTYRSIGDREKAEDP